MPNYFSATVALPAFNTTLDVNCLAATKREAKSMLTQQAKNSALGTKIGKVIPIKTDAHGTPLPKK